MVNSNSRLLGPTHPGRPENEEPHVKRTMKGKKEKVDLICRVDQVGWILLLFLILDMSKDELGIQEDEFEDLKQLFQVPCLTDNESFGKIII